MKKRIKSAFPKQRYKHRLVCLINEDELRLVNRYLERYGITNKSRWLRETVIRSIHKNMADDYPTLFREHDMRR